MKHAKQRFMLLATLLLTEQMALCCINEYRTLLDGSIEFTDAKNAAPFGRFSAANKSFLLQKLHQADSVFKATGKNEDYSDLGAMLIYNGQYQKAKLLYIEIEGKTPGLYATAANLGTTYELLGQVDSALLWINKAIKINPDSHNGSEWIHLKILEAKLKANGDEKYFLTHSILSLDFGDAEKPENKNELDLLKLRKQLYHQLNERMTFVKPKDPIVAQLLFDLGNLSAMTMDVKSGLQVYAVAKEYGFSSELLDKREKLFTKLQQKADFRTKTEGWVKNNIATAFILLLTTFSALVVGLIYLRKRLKKYMRTPR